ncbi:metal-chelation protein CHAD [Hyphomicrobium nitrativorans NL23]|uniref:Metal-chelation protein CHAD n=1 Tax=Hyphomicrobium nitrativorans NL23 TaxID=1029756 RepID=V5SFG5_9HYPH|nr:CHAD domain-containing protein [Hyphomicrobium nitrativorans]AHB48780.1 metal-chelation protein CHAD [Hyphomicrobium nitrativorans NL23]
MAFRFRLHEPITKDFRRIGTEQIERALGQLAAGVDVATEVHEARKCLKRLRALLRLGREGLGEEVFQTENARFREIAGRLSSVRDDHVVIETLVQLEATTADDEARAALRRARGAFLDARAAEDGGAAGGAVDPATLSDVRADLTAALKSFRDLKLSPKSTSTLVAGLLRVYRRGRKSLVTAYATGDDEDFHTFRKAVQAHWRHMALLTRLWPDMFEARVAAARELSQILGDDHDLALLKTRLAALDAGTLSDAEIETVLTVIAARQHMLRRLAEPRGDMLFAASPKAHGHWIATLWDAAAAKAAIDAEAEKSGHPRSTSSKKQAFSRS